VHNPYRWLPDADDADIHDKKTGAAEPRRNFLKSEVSSSSALFDFYIHCLLTTTQLFKVKGRFDAVQDQHPQSIANNFGS